MGSVQIADFATNASPALSLWGDFSLDSNGDVDASSLYLAWKGQHSNELFYSGFPWTTQSNQPGATMVGRPGICLSAYAWRNRTGDGMSWWAPWVDSVGPVPNHAHTVNSPALLPQPFVVDPDSGGPDYNAFTLVWQGDAREGGDGTRNQLWFMPYGGQGWGVATRIAGAQPATSPSACLGLYEDYNYRANIAWADTNGQIWLVSGNPSGDADTPWSAPFAGPSAFTHTSPAICWFGQNLLVAWTLPALGWIMYSLAFNQPDGTIEWSQAARLVDGTTSGSPSVAVWQGTLYVAWRGSGSNAISYQTFGSTDDLPGPVDLAPIGIPVGVTIAIANSQYTAAVALGTQAQSVNLIVDTGSSTLAVLNTNYNVTLDTSAQPTSLAQTVAYGNGSLYFFGPVVTTQVTFPFSPVLDVPLAIATDTSLEYIEQGFTPPLQTFGNAQGIMGLGYTQLNTAADLSAWLNKNALGAYTVPWPVPASLFVPTASQNGPQLIQQFLAQANAVPTPVVPLMTQITQEGVLPDVFALWVNRAQVSYQTSNPATDPNNLGVLVLGGGENFPFFLLGGFVPVSIMSDSFYYVMLTSIQVGANEPILVFPSQNKNGHNNYNAIVDSGTPTITLDTSVYQQVINEISAAVPNFAALVNGPNGIQNSALGAANWPTLTFTLVGPDNGQFSLQCGPTQYIQTDAAPNGGAQFMIIPSSGQPFGNSTLGLTLLTGYYTVFDRSQGVINFAPKPLLFE